MMIIKLLVLMVATSFVVRVTGSTHNGSVNWFRVRVKTEVMIGLGVRTSHVDCFVLA